MTILLFLAIFGAYLLGSIPFGFICVKIAKGIDIRNVGSKNIGATNVMRILGTLPGIFVLLLDFAKGFFAVQIFRWLFVTKFSGNEFSSFLIFIAIAAILGHIFPIFLSFKGGKGVATAAGTFVNLMPFPTLFAFIAFLIFMIIFRYVSLASIIAVITLFGIELYKNITNFENFPFLILTFFIVILIIYRHKENIKRLINRDEPKVNFRKKK